MEKEQIPDKKDIFEVLTHKDCNIPLTLLRNKEIGNDVVFCSKCGTYWSLEHDKKTAKDVNNVWIVYKKN